MMGPLKTNQLRVGSILTSAALTCVACGGDQKNAQAPHSPSGEPSPPASSMDAGASSPPSLSDSAAPQTQATPPAPAAPAPQAAVLTDEQIAAITDAANTAEIAQAKIAETRSKDPGVKRFAAMMIRHHGEAKQKQAKLKLQTAESTL